MKFVNMLFLLVLSSCTFSKMTACERKVLIDGPTADGIFDIIPEQASISRVRAEEAVSFAERMPELKAIIVGSENDVYIKKYLHGYNGIDLIDIKSTSNAFISLLVGIALDEGKLKSVNVRIKDLLPKYYSKLHDSKKNEITVAHLLTQTSGLKSLGFKDLPVDRDMVEFALAQPMSFSPGERFEYNYGNSQILIAVVEAVFRQDAYEFLKKRVLQPLGIVNSRWDKNQFGQHVGGRNFYLHPLDLVRVLNLYLKMGQQGDQRIVSAEWIKESTRKHITSPELEKFGVGYGYHWWTVQAPNFEPSYYEWGISESYVYTSPQYKTTMILIFEYPDESIDTREDQFLKIKDFFHILYE